MKTLDVIVNGVKFVERNLWWHDHDRLKVLKTRRKTLQAAYEESGNDLVLESRLEEAKQAERIQTYRNWGRSFLRGGLIGLGVIGVSYLAGNDITWQKALAPFSVSVGIDMMQYSLQESARVLLAYNPFRHQGTYENGS